MKNFIRHLILPVFLLLQSCDQPIEIRKLGGNVGSVDDGGVNETAVRENIGSIVARLASAEDFDALSKMAKEFRTRRSLTPSGTWKLSYFYRNLADHLNRNNTDGNCADTSLKFFSKWREMAPKDPTPHIARARTLLDLGWCYRGEGTYSSISSDNRNGFQSSILAAHATLTNYSEINRADPEYFALLIETQNHMGTDQAEQRLLFDQAIAREPYYYSHYFDVFRFLQPRWGGSYRQMENFADAYTQMTHEKIRNSLYTRLYWVAVEGGETLTDTSVDWDRMKKGMADIEAQYPSNWNRAHFAKFSCQMDDGAEAAKYFKLMSPNGEMPLADDPEMLPCRTKADAFYDYQK